MLVKAWALRVEISSFPQFTPPPPPRNPGPIRGPVFRTLGFGFRGPIQPVSGPGTKNQDSDNNFSRESWFLVPGAVSG